MNANELMLGNYVKETATNRIGTILYVDFDKAKVKLEHSTLFCPIQAIEPIPLTEKWLLDLGFNKDYKFGYIGIDFKSGNMTTDFVLTYPLKNGDFQKYFIWEHSSFKYNELQYVHELQNLFFILTNNHLQLVGQTNG